MRRLYLSANQHAVACLLGGVISACGFLVDIPMRLAKAAGHSSPFWPWAAGSFTLVLLGFALSMFAFLRLQNGIAAARWPDAEIDRLRALIKSRLSAGLSIAIAVSVALLAGFAVLAHPSAPYRAAYWALYVLGQSVLQLRIAVGRTQGTAGYQPIWSNIGPLRSEHWGNR